MTKSLLFALTAWTVLLVHAAAGTVAFAAGRWRGPDGRDLPFETDQQVLAFLAEAEVVRQRDIPQGINKPQKVRLRRGSVEANAIFRTVNVTKPRHETGGEVYVNFHDSYLYECAAYELSRLLGLDNVPPCVPRSLGKRRGTMQLWVEKAMTEVDRRKKKLRAPVAIDWARQQQTMRLFDALIYNFDRNQGNMLIDADWKLWFIDHTRSFHHSERIAKLDRIVWVERRVWQKLKELDRQTLVDRLGDLVNEERLEFLLERRRRLIEHLEGRIALAGEEAVIFDAPDQPAG